jgi:hypothetical protein
MVPIPYSRGVAEKFKGYANIIILGLYFKQNLPWVAT